MKRITLTFAIVMVFVSLGCKNESNNGFQAAVEMDRQAEFKDEMCKCKDAKCAKDVTEKLTKWRQEMGKDLDREPAKMREEDQKKMHKCMQTAMSAGRP